MLLLSRRCPVCKHASLMFDEDLVSCTNCAVYNKPLNIFQKPFAWASGKWWWWRVPILLWFGIMLVQNWHDPWFAIARTSNPFSAFDFGIHELGHLLFQPFGEFLYIAGGSLFQCLFPVVGIFAFLQIRWYFAAAMCLPWLGLNLFDVATYAADARDRLLPLGGWAGLSEQGSNEAYDKAHDWYQLLSRTHHLQSDQAIAHGLRVTGTSVILCGIILGSVLVTFMLLTTLNKFTAHETAEQA